MLCSIYVEIWFVFQALFIYVSYAASTYASSALAVHRLMAMILPHRFNVFFTTRPAIASLIIMPWLISVVINIFPTVGYGIKVVPFKFAGHGGCSFIVTERIVPKPFLLYSSFAYLVALGCDGLFLHHRPIPNISGNATQRSSGQHRTETAIRNFQDVVSVLRVVRRHNCSHHYRHDFCIENLRDKCLAAAFSEVAIHELRLHESSKLCLPIGQAIILIVISIRSPVHEYK